MIEDPMKADRDWYDNTELDYLKMRRTELRRTPGSGPRSTFAVRLEGEIIDQLRRIAAEAGIGPTQLARQWILERLIAEQDHHVSTNPPLQPAASAELAAALRPMVREIVAEQLKEAASTSRSKRTPAKPAAKRAATIGANTRRSPASR